MKIAVFGLGYVGCVSAACLARQEHRVVGVDNNPEKVARIRRGESPILEAGVPEMIAEAVRRGSMEATTDAAEAVANADVSLVCVGTPSNENGSLSLESVREVCREIGAALRSRSNFHVVALRSTMLPDALEQAVLDPLERESGLRRGLDFGVCVNPEFLREGSAVADYEHPPFTLIGSDDERSRSILERLYTHLKAPVLHTDLGTASMVKYASNAFHALKVCFANELGRLSKELGVDGGRVMEIFSQDKQLNISERYLRPGFAFGGSCLPKDLRALVHRSRVFDLDLHLLDSVLRSNRAQVDAAHKEIVGQGNKRIGILGLSFKSGTDDLRESPMVDLVERLIGQGYDLRILDPAVSLANLIGTNREYVEKLLPHVASLLVSDPLELIEHAELVVVGGDDPHFGDVLRSLRANQPVVDLRCSGGTPVSGSEYKSLCR